MDENEWLAEQFEARRGYLRGVAYRILGSPGEADDAVQEAWLRLSRSDASSIENLGGWLTTVVARACLDMLRRRKSRPQLLRGEEPLEAAATEPVASGEKGGDPEGEALLAESVGLALLVVLETLSPAERVAFVLHDLFAVPFDEIAPIVGRSPAAARQLASRARRRVQGSAAVPVDDLALAGQVVDAFLAASRRGDFAALLAVLDPDVFVRADVAVPPADAPREVHGAEAAAEQALTYARGLARFARPALVNGALGAVVAPRGRPFVVLVFTIRGEKISEIEVIAEAERLQRLELVVL